MMIRNDRTGVSHLPVHSIPVDAILKLTAKGRTVLEIASDLELGRDEVAMVLNINRR